MKEVVTLQFGNYANFVGAHFWNFQDELLGRSESATDQTSAEEGTRAADVESDVLFRVGETHQGAATYTPRLVALDVRGSSGTIPPSGVLYQAPLPSADESIIQTWGGQKAVYRSQPIEKNAFLKSLDEEEDGESAEGGAHGSGMEVDGGAEAREADLARVAGLEDSVQYWTDYLKVHLHPKSLYELPDTWQGMNELSTYGEGVAAFQKEETREEMEERVRFFAEESDHMQGFQCIVDDSGGFAAVAAGLLTSLSDEYPRLPRVLFAVRPHTSPRPASALNAAASANNPLARALHEAVSLAALSRASDLYISDGACLHPDLFPHLALQPSKPFHTSAVHAAAFDAFTTPYRLPPRGASSYTKNAEPLGALDMRDLVRLLARTDRQKVTEVALSFPAPGIPKMPGPDARLDRSESAKLGEGLGGLVRSLVVLTDEGAQPAAGPSFAESLVFRGARYADGSGPVPPPAAESALHASLEASGSGRAVRHFSVTSTPLPIPLPFPKIFRPEVGRHGDVSTGRTLETGTVKGGVDVESVPVMSRLAVTPRLAPMLRSKLEGLERYGGFRKGTDGARILEEWGFGEEEAREMRDGLKDMVKAYEGVDEEDSFDSD
ncbi:tubulin [Klebsormidium nitens]|uniref:Tubulin n=1 Tax=Klebsormidium nitens TaxID=105231 RepID=A0A1Y1HRD0_KLENI|nr:tubulin [Klebsormidium nitens]|eukprot:GAQ79541.1 tubulin [Klebsormidium nitens]